MITLIGGSGFIGTVLARELDSRGKQFKIIDREHSPEYPEQLHLADIRYPEQFEDAIPSGSVIINLAAVHRDDIKPVSLYDENNVDAARNVCSVATAKNCQTIVFTSSVAVYGFAPPDTGENGSIAYFNDYGRTKWAAEKVYTEWQKEDPENRTLVIVRPTVVFGPQNRGNVYNLLKYIADDSFYMVGSGVNKKSMAYVENVSAFLQFSTEHFSPGIHIFNYVDKPDMDMNTLVKNVKQILGRKNTGTGIHIPYFMGYIAGLVYDTAAFISGKTFDISSIRIKKFCATTQFSTSVDKTGFKAPFSLEEGLQKTLHYEFIEQNSSARTFFTE
ncbi:MAG: NAD-dependent epimerase/dehydratase family protein [Balneolales bacterium]|nr:NAD-dependent epimerase/dehydratase family protein [Balneolales bacterium]